ncbi:phospholipid phosphatase 1-like isoform X2 [Mya arenaria]|uniref:phospholipid phosphatase 1-like isoform X2 n=1 Tax=Mya arenaria TaxID=6604 RepID=UPI0022E5B2B5|nr:phospholipid phosphatase 1-like isoform X2 [Mya arenaria]
MVVWGYCNMDKCPRIRSGLSRRRITLALIIDVTLFLIVGIPVLFLFIRGTPFERGFQCDDPALSLPYRADTVSTSVLIIAGYSVSILLVLLVELLNAIEQKCRHPCNNAEGLVYCVRGYSVFLVGFVLQQLIVEIAKNQLGSLRPNFFDVCRPQYNRSLCPEYIREYTCTGSEYGADKIRESRQSFPSGHSSFSMYIAIYFSFYIQWRLQVTFSRILKLFLQFGLVFLSLMSGLGRIQDNKHHPSDVIFGFLVGLSTAILLFHFVGKKLLTPFEGSVNITYRSNGDQRDSCCTCGTNVPTFVEPQTTESLLHNEYFSGNGSVHRHTACTLKLNEIPNSRHQMPTPITPDQHVEEV